MLFFFKELNMRNHLNSVWDHINSVWGYINSEKDFTQRHYEREEDASSRRKKNFKENVSQLPPMKELPIKSLQKMDLVE